MTIPIITNADDYNRATRYLDNRRYDKALQFYRKQTGEFKEKYLNMGNCYKFTHNPKKAYECYLMAADSKTPFSDGVYGDYDLAINNLGLMEYAFGNDSVAMEVFSHGINVAPNNHSIRWHLGISQLRQVFSNNLLIDKVSAFINYDYRFYLDANKTALDACYTRWDGVSTGDSIIVLAEQGLGDKIQWNRYSVLLKRYFRRVVLQIPEMLWPLFPGWEVCTTRDNIVPCTHSVPLCSLTRYFDINDAPHDYLGTFSGYDFGGGGLKIGIVNSGSPGHKNDYNRSCNISYFSGLAGPSIQLYNLQPNAKPARNIINLNPKTWLETCGYVSGLDLIISVDTSIVHIAGALNKPCWMLNPLCDTDFRWGDDTMGVNNVWYPTVRVLRNPNNWDALFKTVKESLSDFNCKS